MVTTSAKKKNRFRLLVHRLKVFRNMPYAFGMCAMGMRIEPDIVEIGGSPFRHLSDEIVLYVWFDFWGVDVPGIHIGCTISY